MIRKAEEKDIARIEELLSQVCLVHHKGRPDLFKVGRKYSAEELREIFRDPKRPVLVCVDERDEVMGYCFCLLRRHEAHPVLTDVRTLYIDDLCVDESLRGRHVGKRLYEAALSLAKAQGCYNLTLNVWSCNPSAMAFYRAMGLVPQKVEMERILED